MYEGKDRNRDTNGAEGRGFGTYGAGFAERRDPRYGGEQSDTGDGYEGRGYRVPVASMSGSATQRGDRELVRRNRGSYGERPPLRRSGESYEEGAPVRRSRESYGERPPVRRSREVYEEGVPGRRNRESYGERTPGRRSWEVYEEGVPGRRNREVYEEEAPRRRNRESYGERTPGRRSREVYAEGRQREENRRKRTGRGSSVRGRREDFSIDRERAERMRRRNRRRRGRRGSWNRMSILAICVCTVLLFLGGIHFIKANWRNGRISDNGEQGQGENGLQEVMGPMPAVAGDVLQGEPGQESPLIVIDPGHGGVDVGCNRGDILESEINLQIANRLSGKLQNLGYETFLLREDNDTDLSLEERVEKAESVKADIYVSIHQNAYDRDVDDIKGVETYHGKAEGSIRLAELVHQGAVERSGAEDREIQGTGALYVLNHTSMPSCLIETAFLSSRSDRANITSGEYQDKMAEGIAQGIDTYFHPQTMYLTFDDGPSAESTGKVLDILKERNIKATFFVVGENVRKHPDVARRIVEEGHTIGIHCYTHDYEQLYKSVDSYLEDFQKAYDAVREVTGVEAKLFRFPGGSVNHYNKETGAAIIEAMTEKGYIYFDWNASLEDATKESSTPEALVQNAVNSAKNREKVVMLAHDVVSNTSLCLEKLIDSFPEYEMKPLTEDVEPIQF